MSVCFVVVFGLLFLFGVLGFFCFVFGGFGFWGIVCCCFVLFCCFRVGGVLLFFVFLFCRGLDCFFVFDFYFIFQYFFFWYELKVRSCSIRQTAVPALRLVYTRGAGHSSEVERSLMVQWVVGSILYGVDPLSYFSLQPVLHDRCNKGRGMCYPVCWMVHIKEPLLLIDNSSLCGGSGFPFSSIRMVLNHMSDAI